VSDSDSDGQQAQHNGRVPTVKEAAVPIKIFQSEMTFGVLLEGRDGKLHHWTYSPPLPLQCVDRNTGESTLACWLEMVSWPEWAHVRAVSESNYELCTADRAGSNDKAHRDWIAARGSSLHIRFPCDAHIVSTVTGRVYAAVDGCISGIIALAMCMRSGTDGLGLRLECKVKYLLARG
jgi:hypothetical protein